MENFLSVFLLKMAPFLSRTVQSHPMYLLSCVTDSLQNYIPLSHPHYIHHTKYTQNVDKPVIHVMIGSDANMIIHKTADMIMHKCINV